MVSALVDFVDGADQPQHLVQRCCILSGGEPGIGAGALEPRVNDQLFQFLQLFLHPAVAACKADLGFQLFQGGLAMLDGIPCA